MSKSRPPFGAKSRSFLELLTALTLISSAFLFANHPRSVSASPIPRLIISEVYAVAVLSGFSTEVHEWVEIHNPERWTVHMNGWTIEDSQAIASLPDISIAGGDSVVVVGRSAIVAVPPGKTLIILDTARIGTGLRNAGDRVALVDPYGVRYDAVSWGDVRTPQHMESPDAGPSIVRTPNAGQRMSDEPTPWRTRELVAPRPKHHAHPRPDTQLRIVSARLDHSEERPESVSIQNVSDRPLLTVNWRLTVGSISVRIPSVRINPRELYTITEADGELGGGLSRQGGHLVLRDADGNWLATASWGDDKTFHDLIVPVEVEEVHFNPLARVHPRVPWHERFYDMNRTIVGDQRQRHSLTYQNVLRKAERVARLSAAQQESDRDAIWISEVYPAAGQGRNDAAFEWFEISNSSDVAVDLSGWTIADNRSNDPLDGLMIPPQSSVVVAGSSDAAEEVSLVISDGRIGNGLANAGDRLTLIDADGEIVSAISWGNDRAHANVKAPIPGQSLHRSSATAAPTVADPSPGERARAGPQLDASAPEDQDDGVDGARGSVEQTREAPAEHSSDAPESTDSPTEAPGLRITELLPAPLPGEAEWVEIFNPSDQPIDLAGWTIGDLTRRTPLSGTIPARSYLVVSNLAVDASAPVLVVDRIGNSLNNDADTVDLRDPQGEAQFSIRYGTADVPAPGQGLSLALEPERWVVTAVASPGSAEVTPLVDDAFRSPSVRPSTPEDERLPLVAEPPDEGLNAWMIVSFALIGVILTLIVRRWQPEPEPHVETGESATYTGPPPDPSQPHEGDRTSDNQPE